MSPQPTQERPQQDRRAIRQAYADDLLLTAEEIDSEYKEALDKKQANREELRNMARQGHLNGDQRKQVDTLYPERKLSREALQKRAEKRAAKGGAAEQAKQAA